MAKVTMTKEKHSFRFTKDCSQKIRSIAKETKKSMNRVVEECVMNGYVKDSSFDKEAARQIAYVHDRFNQYSLKVNQNIDNVRKATSNIQKAYQETNRVKEEEYLCRAETLLEVVESEYHVKHANIEKELNDIVNLKISQK